MTLYHGSFQKIDHIDLSLCRPYTDFGRGFYLTPSLAWAEFVFKNREIVLEDLTHSIRNHNNDIQYCFCSEAAIKLLIIKP